MNIRNDKDEECILYSEWVPITKFIPIAILLLIAVLIAITTSVLEPQEMALTISLCGVLSLFFIFIELNFRGIKITVTNNEIEVKFGLLSKKIIPLKEIVRCEVTKASFNKYLGFGVRVGTDSSLAFTTSFGDAVKLTYRESKLFVFSTKNHQKLCNLLSELNVNQ